MKLGCDSDLLVNYFKDYPLEFTPGSKFRYCNSGYHLLGLIIEQASGMSYEEYIHKNLIAVADMEHSLADNHENLISNRAAVYEKSQEKIVNTSYIDMSVPFSAGNLLSTTIDLNKWYQCLFEYRIVSKNSLQKALTPYRLNDGSITKYGYGWFIDRLQGELVISHEGGINGFLSSAWFIPNSKMLTVILSNCMCNPTTNTAKTVLAYAIGKPLKKKKRIALPLDVLNRYSGSYNMNGEQWTITVLNGELHFGFDRTTSSVIYAKSKNEFYAEEWDSKFIFTENEGKIKLHFIYLGGEIIGYNM